MRNIKVQLITLYKEIAKKTLNAIWRLKNINEDSRIIYYHSVNDDNDNSHSIAEFDKQLSWLYQNNYKCPLLKDVQKFKDKEKVVFITFDDGYLDNVVHALPVLQKYGFKATFFISTKYTSLSSDRFNAANGYRLYDGLEMMNLSDLKILLDGKMEVGSHGVTHRMISRLNKNEQTKELLKSKNFLEDYLGIRIQNFVYPNGQKGAISEYANRQALKIGYKHVYTTLWGTLKNVNGSILPRCEMSHLDSIDDFIDKVQGKRDYRYYIDRILDKSSAWD